MLPFVTHRYSRKPFLLLLPCYMAERVWQFAYQLICAFCGIFSLAGFDSSRQKCEFYTIGSCAFGVCFTSFRGEKTPWFCKVRPSRVAKAQLLYNKSAFSWLLVNPVFCLFHILATFYSRFHRHLPQFRQLYTEKRKNGACWSVLLILELYFLSRSTNNMGNCL